MVSSKTLGAVPAGYISFAQVTDQFFKAIIDIPRPRTEKHGHIL